MYLVGQPPSPPWQHSIPFHPIPWPGELCSPLCQNDKQLACPMLHFDCHYLLTRTKISPPVHCAVPLHGPVCLCKVHPWNSFQLSKGLDHDGLERPLAFALRTPEVTIASVSCSDVKKNSPHKNPPPLTSTAPGSFETPSSHWVTTAPLPLSAPKCLPLLSVRLIDYCCTTLLTLTRILLPLLIPPSTPFVPSLTLRQIH
jgi:hypothetical protein